MSVVSAVWRVPMLSVYKACVHPLRFSCALCFESLECIGSVHVCVVL